MSWFKVDDSFHGHPKVKRIPRSARKAAVALWTLAGSYCSFHLTDGHLLADDVLDNGGSTKDAEQLVAVGLWHSHGHNCDRCPDVPEGEYLFHDWLDYNPSREQVLAERKAAAERQRRAREKAKSQRDAGQSHAVTNGVSHAGVTALVTVPPTRPDPTRSCSSVDLDGGGSVPRELEPPPPDSPFCPNHPTGTSAACADCRSARLAVEARRDVQTEQGQAARRAATRARRECQLCDDNGLRPVGDNAVTRCDHQPERTTA